MERMYKTGICCFICFMILTLSTLCFAVEEWVVCGGEAAIQHITREEAEILARRRARLHAIEKVCGIQIQSETLVKDFMLAGDFIHSVSYGQVVDEKDVRWQIENLPVKDPSQPPVILLKMTMLAKVAISEDKQDPSFQIKSEINRTAFQTGDEVVFMIHATRDCYVSIFSIAANDSVYILFPNTQFSTSNFIQAGKSIEVPNEPDRISKKTIRVATLPGHKKDTEIVKIVATKKNIKYLENFDTLDQYGLIGTPRVAVSQIAQWLASIPVSERAESSMIYTVQSD